MAVDGRLVEGLPGDAVAALILGPPGSVVTLELRRPAPGRRPSAFVTALRRVWAHWPRAHAWIAESPRGPPPPPPPGLPPVDMRRV